ncbi:MAG: MFS transporter [Oscillospiraceae bacterium]|nr:MFS transporter [Oscillospiraceae bacterium]
MPYIHSCCMTLETDGGRVYFAQREFDEIAVYSIASDGSEDDVTTESIYDYDNAGLLVFDIALDLNNDLIYFTDKKGNIFKADKNGVTSVYTGGIFSEDIDFFEVPNCISISENSEKLYYTDIGRREVFEIDLSGGERQVIFKRDYDTPLDENPIYYRIGRSQSCDEGFAVCSSGDGTTGYVVYENGKIEQHDSYEPNSSIKHKYILLSLCALILLATIIIFGGSKLVKTFRSDKGEKVAVYTLTFVAILTIFLVTAVIILNNTGKRYNERVQINIYYLASIVSQYIDGDVLERIDSPDDYLNEDYNIVRDQLHKAFAELPTEMESMSKDTDNTTYCTLYRMKNNVVYYTMHLSDDDGVIYPDEYTYNDSDYKLVYDTNTAHSFTDVTTADGRWLFTVAPIYNSENEMVALCEVGLNLVSYEEADRRVIREVFICVGSLTVAISLLLSEFMNLAALLNLFEKLRKENKDAALPVEFVRPFAFLIYMADNFTSVIIPLMSEQMYTPDIPIPQMIAIALPLAAQAAAAAVSGFMCGRIIEKIGNRRTFFAGIIFHIVGLTGCALSPTLYAFICAMLVVGIGMGLNIVCMNTFIVQNEGDDNSGGFSLFTMGVFGGTNCGIIIGTILSERTSYSLVFMISAIVALLVFITVKHFYRSDVSIETHEAEEKSSIGMKEFLLNFKMLGYLLFALAPYFIFASFVFYFVPIYADSQGLTESGIGLITLVYGLMTAYMSGVTTKYIVNKIGAGASVVAASLITAGSLALFILDPSITSLIFVVLIMGFADSFGYPALSVYFSENKLVALYGEGKAMGIYNAFEGAAETAAPMIFGAALAVGEKTGMIIMGGGFALCAVLFAITLLIKKNK